MFNLPSLFNDSSRSHCGSITCSATIAKRQKRPCLFNHYDSVQVLLPMLYKRCSDLVLIYIVRGGFVSKIISCSSFYFHFREVVSLGLFVHRRKNCELIISEFSFFLALFIRIARKNSLQFNAASFFAKRIFYVHCSRCRYFLFADGFFGELRFD